jgi:hypothetical protein
MKSERFWLAGEENKRLNNDSTTNEGEKYWIDGSAAAPIRGDELPVARAGKYRPDPIFLGTA